MSDHERTASLMTPSRLAAMRPRPASSAAWLDQMASDAGHQHVDRLHALCAQLREQAGARDGTSALSAMQLLEQSLGRIDFELLQPRGWLARATGKGRSAGAEFAAQVELATQACEAVKVQVQQFARQHQAQAAAAERTVVETEVEYRGADTIIEQGARWLQDMRQQLKDRQAAAAGDEAARRQVREDAARCEILVARLKALRAASGAAQQAHRAAQVVAARRAAAVAHLQGTLASALRAWQLRMAPVATAAANPGSPALGLDGPMETQRELLAHLREAATHASELQAQEAALADALAQLDRQLQAALPRAAS